MANYTNLKNIIDQYITTNGQGEITGAILNDVLKSIVDSIGADFLFAGVAEPTTNPGSPDQNVFYIAAQGGKYANFGNVVIPNGITIFKWNGSWAYQILFASDGGVFDVGVNVVGSNIRVNITPSTTINLGISLKAGVLYTFNLKCTGNNFSYIIKNGSNNILAATSNQDVNFRPQNDIDNISIYIGSAATSSVGIFYCIDSELNLNKTNSAINTLTNKFNSLSGFIEEYVGDEYQESIVVTQGSVLDSYINVDIPEGDAFTLKLSSAGGFWPVELIGTIYAIDDNNNSVSIDSNVSYRNYEKSFIANSHLKKIRLNRGAVALISGTINFDLINVRVANKKEFTVYVDSVNGSDVKNNGTSDRPFKTIEKALLTTGENTTIILRGDTNENLNLKTKTNQSSVTIIGESRQKSRIILGSKISEAIQYSGNVYYKDLTNVNQYLSLQDYHIFQHEVPDSDTLISDAERHPLQRGREYRCESTMLLKAASIQDVVDGTKPSYFWQRDGETNNGRLYFKIVNGTTLASNPIYLPLGQKAIYGNDGSVKLLVINIDTWYGQFDISKCNGAVMRNCSAKFAYAGGGFQWDNAVGVTLDRCEASRVFSGTSTGDGFNAHSTESADAGARHTTCSLIDCWSHDNNDDGYSDHERCECSIHGGLFEYNGKAGVTPSFGSHLVCYSALSRRNLNGFYCVGVISGTEGGKYSQMICYNCVAENNSQLFGFGVTGTGNSIKLINCKSIQNLKGYYAYAGTSIELIDCGFVGTSAENTRAKQAENGATITVNNTTLVE